MVAEGVKICIVASEPAKKCELGMPIARQIDAVVNAAGTAPGPYADLLGAAGRVECEGMVLA
jgi:glycerol-3-phosphate dehydrogenase